MPPEKRNSKDAYQGPKYFTFKGELLTDRRTKLGKCVRYGDGGWKLEFETADRGMYDAGFRVLIKITVYS